MFRILFAFYRNFVVVTGSISVIFCFIYWSTASLSFAFTLFWTKLITNFLIGLLFIVFNRDATLFYNNLGYSSSKMYTGMMLLDLMIWWTMITAIFLIR